MSRTKYRLLFLRVALLCGLTLQGFTQEIGVRATESSGKQTDARPQTDDKTSDIAIRIGVTGVAYSSSATLRAAGQEIANATASVTDNVTLTIEADYDLGHNLFSALMIGVPPRPSITGQGAIKQLGDLDAVRYGPAVLSLDYRLPQVGRIRPYIGSGVAYAIVLRDHDAAISNLAVRNNFGFVLLAGGEWMIAKRWGVFGDYKKIWLAVDAHGVTERLPPVTARLKLDPSLISVGVKYHF